MILKKVLKTNNDTNIRLQMLFMCILLSLESLLSLFASVFLCLSQANGLR